MTRPAPPPRRAAIPAPPLPLSHPAALIAIAAAAAAIVVSVSFRIADTDLWQLLVVGKATWTLHRIPTTDLWSWPHHGAPQVASSWLFRALLWPLWDLGGVAGLYAWRWASTLAAFALVWAAARRGGARGLIPLVVLAWCALIYRLRAEVRPETFAAVLFALQVWILETRRRGGPDRSGWAVAIALVWINAHISYHVGILLTGVYLIAERNRSRLALVLAASLAVSFLHPSGWRAFVQPFEYFFRWPNEPMYQAIQELQPLNIADHWKSGLPLLLAGWPVLALWRTVHRQGDAVEWLLCAALTPLAFSSQRFLGLYALAAGMFVARDLQALVESIRWPRWTAGAWARGGLTAAACVLIGLPEWTRVEIPLGVGIEPGTVPSAACDFMAAHGVRGRAFNHFHLGGYLAYRFWPERERLPFMTTQPENSPREDRALYIAALVDPNGWRSLDARWTFDYLLLARQQSPGERLQETLERERGWALVFTDDAAELFVREGGALAAVADSFAYRVVPPSEESRRQLLGVCMQDTALRRRAIAELDRQAASSPANGSAHQLLGIFAMMEGRFEDARPHFERTLVLRPLTPHIHHLLGQIALSRRDAPAALAEFRRERALHGSVPGLEFHAGQAWRQLGELARARDAYERELDEFPDNAEARDSLVALERMAPDR